MQIVGLCNLPTLCQTANGDDLVLSESQTHLTKDLFYLKQLLFSYVHKAKVSWFPRICLDQAVLSPNVVCHYRIWSISIGKLRASYIFQQNYPLLLLPVTMLTASGDERIFRALVILLLLVLKQWPFKTASSC